MHLCPGRRRLPDGGHQPGGDLAGRASRPVAADRAVGRQPHLDRRPDLAARRRRTSARASRPPAGTWPAVDGHDAEAVDAAIAAARASDRPSMIACRTVIGYGSPKRQGTARRARRAARRRRGRGDARQSRLAASGVRGSGACVPRSGRPALAALPLHRAWNARVGAQDSAVAGTPCTTSTRDRIPDDGVRGAARAARPLARRRRQSSRHVRRRRR